MDLGYGDASEIVVHTFGWLPGTPDDLMLACGVAIGFEDTESPNQPSAFGAGVH